VRRSAVSRRELIKGGAGLALGAGLAGCQINRVRLGWHPEHSLVLR
jgi:hypothetical protein